MSKPQTLPSYFLRVFPSIGLTALSLTLFGGCSHVGRTYDEINPEAAAADVRAHNGYEELKSVPPGTTKIVLRGEGNALIGKLVKFSVSTTSEPCQSFRLLGSTQQAGHGVLLPGIAKMVAALGKVNSMGKTQPFLVSQPSPDQSIQFSGEAHWTEETESVVGNIKTKTLFPRSCGPLISRFKPSANHAYTVAFVLESDGLCTQRVMDATNPDAPIPAEAESVNNCPKL